MSRPAIAGALFAIALFSFFIFPGHAYLQQDTQIYVPILERQWSGALAGDPVAEQQHVSFTLYDELTNGVRWVTSGSLRDVLEGEQMVFRALGLWGVFLMATALGLDSGWALVVVALASLGADIPGPEVMAVEWEPTPRAFAGPLLLVAIGWALRERYWLAGWAAAGAVALHAPTTWPVAAALLGLAVVRRRAGVALGLMVGAALLLVSIGWLQGAGQQRLLGSLPAEQEALERMRTAYDFVSTWWRAYLPRYAACGLVGAAALWRLRCSREARWLLGGLMAAGLASVPASYVLLERAKLAIVPQIQPARALLFVVVTASLAAAVAGCAAARRRQWLESTAWLLFCLLLPAWTHRPQHVETSELAALSEWARGHDGMYAFPDCGHDHSPGWFRATALQPVFVDWKSGGQVNYLPQFGTDWWRRWQAVMRGPLAAEQYAALGIDYVVLRNAGDFEGVRVLRNAGWSVYRVTPGRSQSGH